MKVINEKVFVAFFHYKNVSETPVGLRQLCFHIPYFTFNLKQPESFKRVSGTSKGLYRVSNRLRKFQKESEGFSCRFRGILLDLWRFLQIYEDVRALEVVLKGFRG